MKHAKRYEKDERFVVLVPDARVEPLAVVVEAQHALVAFGAVSACFFYSSLCLENSYPGVSIGGLFH